MRLLLDNLIISSEIRSKVMEYIDRPRTPKVMVDCDVFERTEFSPFKFVSNVFEQRVDEALKYVYANKVSGIGDFIQIAKDIPKYLRTDHDASDDNMTFYMILERNWDFIIISLEEVSDGDDEFTEYWMGLYFTGETGNCAKMLREMGIDVEKAMQDTLVKPKLPPEGYDYNISVIENTLKVCCPVSQPTETLSELFEKISNKTDLEPMVLDRDEVNDITYEDIWFPIKNTGYYGVIYRNRLNEEQTYVVMASNDHNVIHFAGVVEKSINGEYILKSGLVVMYNVYRSVVDELR